MKKILCALVLSVLILLSNSPVEASKSYIGVGCFVGNVDYADKRIGMYDDIRPFGGVVRLGTYLVPNIAFELRYMDISGEESMSGDERGIEVDFDLSAISGLVKADVCKLKRAQLYGLIGWSSVQLEALNISDKHSGFSFGVGMEADVTKRTFFSVEYNHIINVELFDVAGFTILFNGRF